MEPLPLRVRVPTAASSARPGQKDLQTALSIFGNLSVNRTVAQRRIFQRRRLFTITRIRAHKNAFRSTACILPFFSFSLKKISRIFPHVGYIRVIGKSHHTW